MPPDDFDINDNFQKITNQSEVTEAIKQLFDSDKGMMISDLSGDEIKLITRILMLCDLKNITTWEKGISIYLKLVLSKKRKSRSEILEAIKGSMMRKQGFFNRMFNRGNNLNGGFY